MYEMFATVYDTLMNDVPYERFADVVKTCCDMTHVKLVQVIDLGCGTGSMFPFLLSQSQVVWGVEPSEAMLSVAAQSVQEMGSFKRISLIQGEAERFIVPASADACVAVCDVMNYMLTVQSLAAAFRNIKAHLKPGGFFLFDVHSWHKASQRLKDGVYYDISDEAVAFMRTGFDDDTQIISYDLVLLSRGAQSRYDRDDEWHEQRVHTISEILSALLLGGFSQVHIGADFVFDMSQNRQNDPISGLMPADRIESVPSSSMPNVGIDVLSCVSDDLLNEADRWFFCAL